MKIIVSLLIFSILVLVHEWGHYIMAKKAKIFVYEFAIGMGPVIWKKKGKETLFSLRLLPIGGFVRMSPLEDEEPCSIQGEFEHKTPFQRLGVVLAGPVMNITLALILMCMLGMLNGFPTNQVGHLMEGSPAQKTGLTVGDTIRSINGNEITSWENITQVIGKDGAEGKPLKLVVEKDSGTQEELTVVPIQDQGRFIIGISPLYKKDFSKSLVFGVKNTWEMGTSMFQFLGQLFTGRANTSELSGPVGIVGVVGQAIKAGFSSVLFIAALISLNLGIVNLLPIPALDGNKILLIVVEILTGGKRLKPEVEEKITIAGFLILMGILVWVTFNDVLRLFFR